MKIALSLGLFLTMTTLVSSQTIGDWGRDAVLATWSSQMPKGWTITQVADRLVVARTEPIFVLSENKVNAPLNRETAVERAKRIQRFGKADQARLVLQLQDRVAPKSIWVKPSPQYATEKFGLTVVEQVGLEDDFHSIDPPTAAQEFWQTREALLKSLAAVLSPGADLAAYEGQTVVLVGRRASLMQPHPMNSPPGFNFAEYVDWGGIQTVAYSKNRLMRNGPWELTGRVIAVGGENRDPRAKESVKEYHLAVESFRNFE